MTQNEIKIAKESKSTQTDETVSEFSSLIINNQVRYVCLPGKHCKPELQHLQNDLYQFWKQIWSQTFQQISLDFSSHSEEFCRHEEMTGLILDERVIGVAATDVFDLDNPVQKQHKYFASYPPYILERISNLSAGKPIMTFGYLGISSDFRGKFGLTDLLLGLSFLRLLHSQAEIMVTYTRNTRRTNDLTYRIGAKALAKDVTIRGEPSDFVYFDRKDITTIINHPLFLQMIHLWQNKIFDPSPNLESIPKDQLITTNQQTGESHEKSDNPTSSPTNVIGH